MIRPSTECVDPCALLSDHHRDGAAEHARRADHVLHRVLLAVLDLPDAGVSRNLTEAARIDSARFVQVWWCVMLPLGIRPEHLNSTNGPSLEMKIDVVEQLGVTAFVHGKIALLAEARVSDDRAYAPRRGRKIAR
jgi:hypothetical protein